MNRGRQTDLSSRRVGLRLPGAPARLLRWWSAALAALLLAGLPALAQAPGETAAEPARTTRRVRVDRADQLFYEASAGLYHLTGNVVMVHEDTTLYADEVQYDEANDTARATGNLRVRDEESTLTGDLLTADFSQRLAQITGNVTIVTQKRTDPEEAAPTNGEGLQEYRRKQTTITCPRIDYYYAEDRKQATVHGPLKAVQEDKTVYADQALYDGVNDLVTLEGNVRVITERGSEFRAPRATISLAEDWIRAEHVQGVAVTEEDEESPPPPANGAPPPPPQ